MKALIICGGKGTRVQQINKEIPKAMFPIAGKPILQHQIEWLKKYGINEIVFCIGYLGDQIIDFFGDGSKFGIVAEYSKETEPLGTGGAIKNAQEFVDDTFLVVFGDLMIDMNLENLLTFHKKHSGLATIVVHKTDHPWDSDLIKLDNNGKIVEIIKKPGKMERYPSEISKTSIYVLEKDVMEMIHGKCDFEQEILPKIVNLGKAFGYYTEEFIKDMGTPERYEKIKKMFENI